MKYARLAIAAGISGSLLSSIATADDNVLPVRALLADPAKLADWLAKHDPQVEAAGAKIEAASQSAQQAAVLPNPQLSFGLAGIVLGHNSGVPGDDSFGSTTNDAFGLSELVELGKRGPRKEAANLRTREAGLSKVSTLGTQVSAAMTTLGAVAYAFARHEVVVKNLEDSRKIQQLEIGRKKVGETSGLDLRRIELDTHELEVQLQRADADLAGALATCSATLFAPCTTDGLDATSLDAAAPVPDALPDLDRTVEGRPSHEAQRLESEALGQDALVAQRRRIPDPTFGIEYVHDNYTLSGNAPNTIGFSVGIPLPFFDRGNHDAAAARANAHAIEAEDRADVRQERGQVEALRGKLTALTAALQRLDKELEPVSAAVVADTQKSLDIGESSITDLLLAERAHRDLLSEVLDTRNDLFTVRAQLRAALGLDDAAARTIGGPR